MSDDNKKPYEVRTVAGVRHTRHDTLEQAEAVASTANAEAERMGLAVRYEFGPARRI